MFQTFTRPQFEDGDTFKPSENVGKPLIVKVRERKEGIVTDFTPAPGGPGVVLDLVDLTTGQVSRAVLWMNGALVDGLTPYVGGQPLVIKLAWIQGKSQKYVGIEPGNEQEIAYAMQWVSQNGDPFAVQLGTVQQGQPTQQSAPAQQQPVQQVPTQQAPAQQQPVQAQPAPVADAGLGAALGNLTPEQIAQLQQQLGAQPVQGGMPPF